MIVFIHLNADGEELTATVPGVFGHRGRQLVRSAVRRLLAGRSLHTVRTAGVKIEYESFQSPIFGADAQRSAARSSRREDRKSVV